MKTVVVGSGKLAKAICVKGENGDSAAMLSWEDFDKNERVVVIHAGSGRQLSDCINFCILTKSPLIELSTDSKIDVSDVEFPLVICPNTSILILKMMYLIKKNGDLFREYDKTIVESHQSTKTTQPGTAINLADSLSIDESEIVSIRDPLMQTDKIGIPEEYLGKHAYHKITIGDKLTEVTIQMKVLGHSDYAGGVKAIVKAVNEHSLENRKYEIDEFIDNGWL